MIGKCLLTKVGFCHIIKAMSERKFNPGESVCFSGKGRRHAGTVIDTECEINRTCGIDPVDCVKRINSGDFCDSCKDFSKVSKVTYREFSSGKIRTTIEEILEHNI